MGRGKEKGTSMSTSHNVNSLKPFYELNVMLGNWTCDTAQIYHNDIRDNDKIRGFWKFKYPIVSHIPNEPADKCMNESMSL